MKEIAKGSPMTLLAEELGSMAKDQLVQVLGSRAFQKEVGDELDLEEYLQLRYAKKLRCNLCIG